MNEMNWDDARLFLAVARDGGLGPAARKTGKSAPTLGRRMLEFERSLGQELFHRLPRGYKLTEEGQQFFDHAVKVEQQMLSMAQQMGRAGFPLIKISAGAWVTHILCKYMGAKNMTNPAKLRFISADEVLDIRHRHTLIGIRNHPQNDSSLACKKVGQIEFAWFALDPAIDLVALPLSNTPSAQWLRQNVDLQRVIEVTHPRNSLDLVLAGAVKALLPVFIGADQPSLSQIGNPVRALTHDQWLVVHQDDSHIPNVRDVFDQIYNVLQARCVRT